jgi:hypothetical protein
MMARRRALGFLGAYLVGAATGAVFMLGSQTTFILYFFTLLLAAIPTILVALPAIAILHLCQKKSLLSYLTCGITCGLVLAIWSAFSVQVADDEISVLPKYGFVSQSSLVLILSCMAGALTYWYIVESKIEQSKISSKGPQSKAPGPH